ncbi:MAG: FAD-dependent oxidoreductase [Candidatus Rokuibacteriota bacterium]|nr:MAG: FAD-dependent oxidoreductase [Candidatus Rokubacteria bacterium]
MPMEREADVVVVGAGIVGCATAYYLAKRGVRVVVIERGLVCGEQSRKNWGFVRQQGRDPHEVPLMMESNRIWRGLERELGADIEWTVGGNLALAATGERMALFEQWLDVARQYGLDTRVLRPRDLPAVVPGLGGHWVGGLHTPSDGHADPVKTTDAFASAATAHGAVIHRGCGVEGVTVSQGAVKAAVTERGEIRTSWLVCAAGAWSSRLARTIGLALPQRWVRGTVAGTAVAPPVTGCAVWGPGGAFRQRKNGSFTIAAGGALDHDVTLDSLRQIRFFLPNYWKNKAMFRFHVGWPLIRSAGAVLPGSPMRRHPLLWDRRLEPRPNPAKVSRSLAELQRVLPSLPQLRIAHSWAGYIDATPDLTPVLGEVASLRGFVFATGFSGHGFAMGPVAGRLLSELIADGKPSLDLSAFRFSRFAEGSIGKPRNVL